MSNFADSDHAIIAGAVADPMSAEQMCEECGTGVAVYVVEVNGEDVAMCKGCTGWMVNHSIVAPRVHTPVLPLMSSEES